MDDLSRNTDYIICCYSKLVNLYEVLSGKLYKTFNLKIPIIESEHYKNHRATIIEKEDYNHLLVLICRECVQVWEIYSEKLINFININAIITAGIIWNEKYIGVEGEVLKVINLYDI